MRQSHGPLAAGSGVLLLVLAQSPLGGAQPFDAGCTLPFEEIRGEDLDIDATCSLEGVGSSEKHLAQNRAKNNFCASGPLVRVTFYSFRRLQQAADPAGISYGSGTTLPQDRAVLKDVHTTSAGETVGEGSLVRLAAFVLKAHYSNVSRGEAVNCKRKGAANNDIHIALGRATDADLCDCVTAEISPHFRPLAWDPTNLSPSSDELSGRIPGLTSGRICARLRPSRCSLPPRLGRSLSPLSGFFRK